MMRAPVPATADSEVRIRGRHSDGTEKEKDVIQLRMPRRQSGRTAPDRRFEAERRSAAKRRAAAESRPAAKRSGQSAAARRKRRRKRLVKALAAWAACIMVMAGVAAGTVRVVRAVTTGKRSGLRQEGLEKLAQGDYSGAIASFDAALEQAGDKAVEFNTDVLC